MKDGSSPGSDLISSFERPCGDDLRSILQAVWTRLESWQTCSCSNSQDADAGILIVNRASDVVKVDWTRARDERTALLEQLEARLQDEGLGLQDLPDVSDQELLALFAELGFESMLERTKLLKAIKELSKQSYPSYQSMPKPDGAPMQFASSVPVHFESESSSDFVPSPGPYLSGEFVEYYSRSLSTWLPAQIFVESHGPGREPSLFATMLLDGSQRHDICLELLRTPLRAGEPCEVFSPRMWRWLEATVLRGPDEHQVMAGQRGSSYCVSLLEDCGGEAYVPASRLRRRFPEGTPVSIYRGLPTGWIDAVVRSSSSERSKTQPGCAAASPPSPRISEEVDIQQLVPAPVLPDGSTLDFWVEVLVSVEASPRNAGGETLQVSSCFLRRRNLQGAAYALQQSSAAAAAARPSMAGAEAAGGGHIGRSESFASVVSEAVDKTGGGPAVRHHAQT
mmetsp:Transcript_56584/g.104736  ORF Transcript_56584/g.104736 Transcript_56584/m.104736 type:complete len:452 (-) Transcript_56584:95-1450(-)